MRTVFMGTAELACRPLAALLDDHRFEVLAVVTQPDKPKGRDLKLQPSAVKRLAIEKSIDVLQPPRARDQGFIDTLRSLHLDLIVVVAYGQILPQAVLGLPRHGCVNVHTSLLPKYRGAAPIQWAILDDQPETGVTLMKMDAGLDTGPILAQMPTPIGEEDNAQTLHDRLSQLGADLLTRTLPEYIAGRIAPIPQPSEGVTYARKITKDDGQIDWTKPARTIWNQIRAFTPWPGAFTWLQEGPRRRLLKIVEAKPRDGEAGQAGTVVRAEGQEIQIACGQGILSVLALQREGARAMTAQEFLAGNRLLVGTILG